MHVFGTVCKQLRRASTRNRDLSNGKSVEAIVLNSLREKCMFEANNTILLCVSGGCDSMAMLHIFHQLRQKWQTFRCHIIHFNHKVRTESDEEEAFVRSWSHRYDMPLHSFVSPQDTNQSTTDGFQSTARAWRREQCDAIASTLPNCLIATAHHSDDQLETVIMKLLRGVSLPHLHGMLPRDGNYIKPLLFLSKEDLRAYLVERNLMWHEDGSNAKPIYTRNRVRLQLIPLLSSIAGGTSALQKRLEALSSESLQLKQWKQSQVLQLLLTASFKICKTSLYLTQASEFHWLEQNSVSASLAITTAWHKLSPMVQGEVVRYIVGLLMPLRDVSHEHITSIVTAMNKSIATQLPLPEQHTALVSPHQLRIQTLKCDEQCTMRYKNLRIFYNSIFDVQVSDASNPSLDESDNSHTIKALGPWIIQLHNIPHNASINIRLRKDGDVINTYYHNKVSMVKLKRLFIESKVPRHMRSDIPVVTFNDKVIAVPPFTAMEHQRKEKGGNGVSVELRITLAKRAVSPDAILSE